jgi:hypothetical protein
MRSLTFVQRKTILGNAEHAGRIWRPTVVLLLCVAVAIVAIAVIPFMRWRPGLIGFLLGMTLTFIALAVLRVSDPIVHGSWAEQWSLESLRKVAGWLVTDNLPFGDVDVDHVVVTPAGVLAVETKYSGRAFNTTVEADRHRRHLDSALAAARKVTSFLRTQKLPDVPEVAAVLMVWGPGKPHPPDGAREDGGVVIVDAANPHVWSHRFSAPRIKLEARREIYKRITDYIAVRHGYEAGKLPALRLEIWRAFRKGIRDDNDQRRALSALKKSLSKRHGAN